MAAFIGIGV
uniref:Uncharacterized protein n=1 Tax=Arundo donax TaxID=35708 RepID=A0A0A9AM62_ARUDO